MAVLRRVEAAAAGPVLDKEAELAHARVELDVRAHERRVGDGGAAEQREVDEQLGPQRPGADGDRGPHRAGGEAQQRHPRVEDRLDTLGEERGGEASGGQGRGRGGQGRGA